MITFELKNKKPSIKAVIGKEIEEQEITLEQAEIIAKNLLEFICEKKQKINDSFSRSKIFRYSRVGGRLNADKKT